MLFYICIMEGCIKQQYQKDDKWVLAVRPDEDISELKEKADFFGFPVDAGVGGFFDYTTGLEYNKFINELMKKNQGCSEIKSKGAISE